MNSGHATPVPYTTVSCIPGGTDDDISNSVVINKATYDRMLKILTRSAVPERESKALVATRCREHQKRIDAAQAADGLPHEDLWHSSFRVMVSNEDHRHIRSKSRTSFTYYRYSLVYGASRGKPLKVTATYTVKIVYALISGERKGEPYYEIECLTNSASAHGESGSPFSHKHLTDNDEEWVEVLRESYLGPYAILARALRIMQADDLTRLRESRHEEYREGNFQLPFSEDELVEKLKIKTFGFRFINIVEPERVAHRSTVLYMMDSLYSSEARAANAGAAVGKLLKVRATHSRSSDRPIDYFTYDSSSDTLSNDHDADENYNRMSRLAVESARAQRTDPIRSVRLAVNQGASGNLMYHIDLAIPSSRHLHRLYKATDAREFVPQPGATEDQLRKLSTKREANKAFWKAVAQRGFVIGVDAHSFYLQQYLGIATLGDLLRRFSGRKYRADYKAFCTKMLQDALESVQYPYWSSQRWMDFVVEGFVHPKMTPEDQKLWSWLTKSQNVHLNLVQALAAFKQVNLVNGKLGKEDLKRVTELAMAWVADYGYNPLFPLVAHTAVIQNWYACDDLGRKFKLERARPTEQQKIANIRKLFRSGDAALLKSTVLKPQLSYSK